MYSKSYEPIMFCLSTQESASLRKEKRIASRIIGSSSSVSVGSDDDFFECLSGHAAGIIQNIEDNGEQDHREDDGNCRTESDGEGGRDKFRGMNRGGRAEGRVQEGKGRKDTGSRTVSVGSVDYGIHPSYNSSHVKQTMKEKEKEKNRERDREREIEREKEKEKEISMLEAEIKDKKEKQKAFKLVHILERRLSTSSIASKRDKVDLKSYSSAISTTYKPSIPSISSNISTLQQQEHQQKEERHVEHQQHQQHLLEQHAKQQKLMQQQLEDLQLKQQQKLLRQQKKRESRATIPGAPNVSRPSFVTLTSKQPRDPTSTSLLSACRYGIGIGMGSVLGGRQENEAEADTVTCDDFAAFSAAALNLALKQRELIGLNNNGTGQGQGKGRRMNEWMDPITATPGTMGPILSEFQCSGSANTRSISAERNYNHFDNDLASISALLDSPMSSHREVSKRGWDMDVTDDIESQAVLAIMIADRDMEGRRVAKHEGTGTRTGSHTHSDITHLQSKVIEGLSHAHDGVPAVLQCEGQTVACSNVQQHQSHRRRTKHKTSRVVSEMDSERQSTPALNSFTNSSNSGVGRGSGLDTMYSTICSAILLGQELERLSQQFSPIGQGLEQEPGAEGPGEEVEEERLHTTDEKDLNTSSQHQITTKNNIQGSSNASLHFPSAIPTVIKRENTKLTHAHSSDIKDKTEQVLMDGGSVRGIGASDRRRVTLPVGPKFSKMSWQKDKEIEKGNRLDEWERQLQGRGEGGGRSSKQEGNVKDRGIFSGANARRRSAGAPSLKPTSVMMTRQGQLGIGFGTCTNIGSANASESGSCSRAGNGYIHGNENVLDRVMGAGVLDVENRTIDFRKEKEKENGKYTRSSSSSIASTRHMERQVDMDRGRDRDKERESDRGSAKGDQDKGSGYGRVKTALPPNGQSKSQFNTTNISKPCK